MKLPLFIGLPLLIAVASCASQSPPAQTPHQVSSERSLGPGEAASTAQRSQPGPASELRPVIIEDLDSNNADLHWLRTGETVVLRHKTNFRNVYRYVLGEEEELRFRAGVKTLEINGHVVGVKLNNTPTAVEADFLERHRGKARAIVVVGEGKLTQQTADAIVSLSAERLALDLYLGGTEDVGLDQVSALGSKLEYLRLRGFEIGNASLEGIGRFDELKSVRFYSTMINDDGITQLTENLRLESFSIHEGHVTNDGLAQFSKMPALHTVVLNAYQFNGEGLQALSSCKSLRKLHLYKTRVNDDGLRHLSTHSQLSSLNLSNAPITDAGLAHLSKLAGLQEVILDGTRTSADGLSNFSSLESLEILSLHGLRNGDAVVEPLAELEQLRSLNLSGVLVTDSGLVHLSKLSRLQGLNLSRNKISDDGLAHLSELHELISLELQSTKVTDPGLVHLTKLPNLKILNLRYTKVTDEAVEAFKTARPGVYIVR